MQRPHIPARTPCPAANPAPSLQSLEQTKSFLFPTRMHPRRGARRTVCQPCLVAGHTDALRGCPDHGHPRRTPDPRSLGFAAVSSATWCPWLQLWTLSLWPGWGKQSPGTCPRAAGQGEGARGSFPCASQLSRDQTRSLPQGVCPGWGDKRTEVKPRSWGVPPARVGTAPRRAPCRRVT